MTLQPVPEPNLERLQRIFTERRAVSGLSFDQLANKTGLTRGTLINVAKGRYRGDLRTWLLLSRAWEVSLDELLAPVWENVER